MRVEPSHMGPASGGCPTVPLRLGVNGPSRRPARPSRASAAPLALVIGVGLVLVGCGERHRVKEAPTKGATPQFISRLADLDAPVPVVWETLTTPLGLRTFFGPVARVELKPNGAYAVHGDEPGHAGAMHFVESFEVGKRLVLRWGFPRDLPIRDEHVTATLTLAELPGDRTRLLVKLTGFQSGEYWSDGYYYVEDTWDQALDRLKRRFIEGPITWGPRAAP